MRVALNAEGALAQTIPDPNPDCPSHDSQRYSFLPVHQGEEYLRPRRVQQRFGRNNSHSGLTDSRASVTVRDVTGRTYRHVYRVTYAECTLGNHVYYARYLDILEAVRGEFFRQLGRSFLDWQNHDIIFPIIDCRVRYKEAARYDDLLAVELWVTALERVQLGFAYRVFGPAGSLLVEAGTRHVCTNAASRPKRIPKELAASLEPYVGHKTNEPG